MARATRSRPPGLLDGIAGGLVVAWRELPRPLQVALVLVPALAVAGTLARDNHGIPFLLGMVLGGWFASRDPAVRASYQPFLVPHGGR